MILQTSRQTAFLLSLILLLASCGKRNRVEAAPNPSEADDSSFLTEQESLNPLTVEGMRRAVYQPGTVTVGGKVHDNAHYSSHEISFYVDGIKEYALMSTPKTKVPEDGYPVILLLHGYIPPPQYSTVKSYAGIFNRYARSEFSVIKVDFRGHGRSEYGENYDPLLARLYYTEDLRQLIESLKTVKSLNSDKLFIMGHSNGGDIALRLLSSYPDNKVLAASLWGPVTTKIEEAGFFWPGGGKNKFGDEALSLPEAQGAIADFRLRVEKALKKAGIASLEEVRYYPYLSEIAPPIIIRHADTDESVPYAWSLDFQKRFNASGNPHSLQLIPYHGDNHNMAKNQAKAQKADLEWFRSFL